MTTSPTPRRAHRSLAVLIGSSVLLLGAVTALTSAPPSALTALAFAVSSTLLAVTLLLAARVIIFLERARRRATPTIRPHTEDAPLTAKLIGWTLGARRHQERDG